MKKTLLFLFLLALFNVKIQAQELRCMISVVYSKIQTSERQIFDEMQTTLYEFMNNTKWTNNVFSIDERIECSILINLDQQVSQNEFKGTMQIQSSRPIFNSSYNSVLLNYKDNDVQFIYTENEPIEFTPATFTNNLASMLAFYAYIIIGLDYDSYSSEGGSEFYQKAETIVTNAQNAKEKGWKAFESNEHKNRYWLVNNLIDSKYKPMRDFLYNYHRLGLDNMADKSNESRAQMAKDIELLQKLYRTKPDPFMHVLKIMFDAKSEEFVDVFSESPMDEKQRVIRILSEVDPSNSEKYNKIKGSEN